jgi:hypothetical protein
MKKLTFISIIVIILLSSNSVFSQINTFKFESHKTYPNGTLIAYFHIFGISNKEEANFVQKMVREDKKINRFFIYENESDRTNRCMIEASSDVNEEYIKSLINKYIEINKPKIN